MASYLDSLNAATVLRVVACLFAGALFTVLLLAGIYFEQFHGPLSTSQGVWGEFGDFLGGALNSLIGLFALFALFMTIVLQTKELESTREELRRAAASQEKSEVALTKQSRRR